MTASSAARRTEQLAARLAGLRAERERAATELLAPSCGDEADRATNVDAHVRLATLDERIVAAESALAAALTNASATDGTAGIVSVGSVVGLDFGEGAEKYLLAPADYDGPELAVVTPGSPLGRALVGATVGARISYQPRPGQTVTVSVTEVS
jgi:transcription elongation factor GreA